MPIKVGHIAGLFLLGCWTAGADSRISRGRVKVEKVMGSHEIAGDGQRKTGIF